MDPQATWEMLCDALHVLDVNRNDATARREAIALLDILAHWLRRGGAPPQLETAMDMQDWWDELVAQLAEEEPDRESVIACLHQLLDGAERGDPLPQLDEEVC